MEINDSDAMQNEKIDKQAITWFSQMDSHFVFYVKNEDDLDRVIFLLREYNINKSRTYLAPYPNANEPSKDVPMIYKKAKLVGCNLVFNYFEMSQIKLGDVV